MTTPLRSNLLFDDPGALIAAIPGLLRFTPTDSIVLVSYTGPRALTLEAVLRMDLPDPEHLAEVAQQLRVVALNHEATVIEMVVLGGGSAGPPDLPLRPLVEELDDVLDRAGIVLSHPVWAPRVERGLSWWCYEDPECTGQIRDPDASVLTAALTVAGVVTHPNRAELAARLTPAPAEARARLAELIAALPAVDPDREYPFIRDTIDEIIKADPDAELGLDDPTIARLSHALTHADVREACLVFTMTVRADAAERLWTLLTRAAPAPTAANPASLLAVSAYLRGEGTLAGIAIDAALAADPTHRLARTVRGVMDHGFPPHKFRALLAESFVAAFANR